MKGLNLDVKVLAKSFPSILAILGAIIFIFADQFKGAVIIGTSILLYFLGRFSWVMEK